MKIPNEILGDIVQLAGGAVSLMDSAKQQIKNDIKTRTDTVVNDMDLVSREDLDRVEALIQKVLNNQKDIVGRLDKLENKSL